MGREGSGWLPENHPEKEVLNKGKVVNPVPTPTRDTETVEINTQNTSLTLQFRGILYPPPLKRNLIRRVHRRNTFTRLLPVKVHV